jgi:hypothetical protein
MGTSRSEAAGPARSGGAVGEAALTVPDRASPEATAAIAAAVGAYLRARRAAVRVAATSAADADGWRGRRWTFAGRLAAVGDPSEVPRRPAEGAPTDAWVAADRADRMGGR